MSKKAMQQALDAIEDSGCKADLMAAADALRAALAEPEPRNNCAETCERAKLCATCARGIDGAEQAQPVAWRYKPMVGSPWSLSDDGYYVSCKRDNGYIVQPLYTTPHAPIVPQPLTDEEILSVVGWERAEMYMKLTPNFPVDEAKQETLKNARAVEAEMLKRMGVGK